MKLLNPSNNPKVFTEKKCFKLKKINIIVKPLDPSESKIKILLIYYIRMK